jgi:hypothetical protein
VFPSHGPDTLIEELVPDHAVLFDDQVVFERDAMRQGTWPAKRTVRTSSRAVLLVELPGA